MKKGAGDGEGGGGGEDIMSVRSSAVSVLLREDKSEKCLPDDGDTKLS